MIKCLKCGRFCKDVVAIMDGLDNITKVVGLCKKCGKVDLTNGDWNYEDFFAP